MIEEKLVQRKMFLSKVEIHSTRVARWHVFKPKNPNMGKLWRVMQWKVLV
jgi:hypothetical protein